MNRITIMPTYAEEIFILGDTKNQIIKTGELLIDFTHYMGLVFNESKTKNLALNFNTSSTSMLLVFPPTIDHIFIIISIRIIKLLLPF